MKKSLISTVAISLFALVLVAVMFFANSNIFAAHANADNDIMIHVIEHANTDTVGDIDNGKPAPDALGNVLAFHNPVFDVADQKQVGHDNGDCVRTVTGKDGIWECFWTVFLSAGQITVEGPYNTDATDTILAITGGTGAYNEARGQMTLHDHFGDGTQYDFIYELEM
jgi:allene oxide cyclase